MKEFEEIKNEIDELKQQVQYLNLSNDLLRGTLNASIHATARFLDREHKGKNNLFYQEFTKSVDTFIDDAKSSSPEVKEFYKNLLSQAFGDDID